MIIYDYSGQTISLTQMKNLDKIEIMQNTNPGRENYKELTYTDAEKVG